MSKLGTPSPQNERHLARIQVIKYCKNPEYYLEEAACEYLKANPYEENDSYEVRLSRAYSSFEPVYTHLRNLVVGTALRRKIVTSGATGPDWERFFKNVDLEGNVLQVFTRNIFSDAVDGGWAGILVTPGRWFVGISRRPPRNADGLFSIPRSPARRRAARRACPSAHPAG